MEKSKSEIRKEIISLRKQLNSAERIFLSQSIFKKIEQLEVFYKADTIAMFWSLTDEVFTHDYVQKWSLHKNILLPVTLKKDLQLKEFNGINDLIESPVMKLKEPKGKSFTSLNKLDLIIVPGLAFDKQNNRIGYGKGYYDRLLLKLNAFKIGVCFDFQLFNEIPYTTQEIKMDKVLTN